MSIEQKRQGYVFGDPLVLDDLSSKMHQNGLFIAGSAATWLNEQSYKWPSS